EETRSGLAADVLTELSNVLEELRVSSEELNRQHQELMLAHAEREQERRKYLDLFQSAPDGYVVTDHGGIVQEVNETAEGLPGVPPRTLCAAPLSFRLVPGDLPSFREMLLSDAPVQVEELRLRRRGYGTFLATVTRTVIRNDQGAVTGHRWSMQDLTPVKEQEKRRRESEGLLRSLVDGAKDFAIFRLDVSGNVASWNTGAERIFGYTAEEVVGKSFDIFREREDQDTSQKQLLELADRYGRSEIEGWRVHRNGKRIWTNSVTTPLRDTRGRLTGFVKVLRDVTDRRRTEEALAERSRLFALQAHVGAAPD